MALRLNARTSAPTGTATCRGRCLRTRRHSDRRASAQEGTGARVKELRRANEILKLASAFFAQVELGRRFKP
ncbi:hypothetical protein FZC30_13100 [Comamonas thiooxydans]|nr:hypothetical protein FZC30_13100 [Comamonas thiooxydans]